MFALANESVKPFDFSDFLSVLKRKKITVIASLLFSLIGAVFYVMKAVPLYEAETTVFLDTRQNNVLDGAAVLAGLTGDSSVIESEVEIIRSRELATRVVDKLNLYDDEEFSKKGGFLTALKDAVFYQSSGRSRDEIKSFNAEEQETPAAEKAEKKGMLFGFLNPPEKKISDEMLKSKVTDALLSRLTVKRVGLTQVIKIAFVSRTPSKAKKIADAVAGEYLNEQLEAKLDATKRATEWLDEKLSLMRGDLSRKQEAIVSFKQRNNLFSANGATQTEQQVARLNEQLILAKVETAEKKAKYDQVSRLAQTGSLQSFSGVLSSGVIAALRDKEAELSRDIAELSERYGAGHPKLKNAMAQISDIRKQVALETSRIVQSSKSEYQIAQSREGSLAANLGALKKNFDQTGRSSVRLQQLEREEQTAQDAYDVIAKRFRQTDNSDKVQQSDARVISKAEIPGVPFFPNKKVILFMAGAFGLTLGCLIAFLQEYLITGFMIADDVENVTGLPVISNLEDLSLKTLKSSGNGEELFRYVLAKPLSSMAESVRKIRVAVDAEPDIHSFRPKVIMVTSSVPNEGKTGVTLACAASAANAGLKVLVIDADFRNPSIAKAIVGVNEVRKGLGEYLLGQCDIYSIINRQAVTNIDYIGVNAIPRSPSDTLKNGILEATLQKLRAEYDVIFIDTPPLAPVVDSRVIADMADKIIYIVRWQKTPRETVKSTIRSLHNNHNKIVGIAFNRVNLSKESQYGYGYGYSMANYSKDYYKN